MSHNIANNLTNIFSIVGGALGGVVGSILGKKLTDHKSNHHKNYEDMTTTTTIQRGETYANGCYKQTVKEPDSYNRGHFIETEQMICPPNVQPSIPVVMPQNPQPMIPIQPNISLPMAPVSPLANQPQVIVLSRRTGSYKNTGNNFIKTSVAVLVTFSLFVHVI